MEYEALKELCKTVDNELMAANDKIRAAGGKLTQGDVAYLDQLTHMVKSIKTTMAMLESEGGSNRHEGRGSYEGHGSYDDRSYDSSNYQGGAYRESNRYVSPEYHDYDGESQRRRRDSMGRYM